jgi:transposase
VTPRPSPTTLEGALVVIEHLLAINAQLQARIAELKTRIAELEERLRQSSQNSSRPPSSDAPSVARPAKRPPSGRAPGGQPGHEGHARLLLPVEQVDRVVPVKPPQCGGCGAPLHGEDPTPRRHQVTELPRVRPHVTEYQLHTLTCAACGLPTAAAEPAGVPPGAFGPRLTATIALCSGLYHLSKRATAGLLADLFGVDLALGTVTACEQTVSAALAAPVVEAHAYVQQQPVVHADETGWREARQRAWLWVAVSPLVTVFLVHARRGVVAARALLGTFAGILVTDRWGAYLAWPLARRQLCWAHLLREFTAFSERGGAAARIGQALRREATQMFASWYRVRDGTVARAAFQAEMRARRRRVHRWLRQGAACPHAKTAGTCRELLKLAPALWTFVDVPGVEPTNNAAERALRPAVLWRKGCFGTHSADGSRFVERLLTVAATLKHQHRNVVDYLTAACTAALHGQPSPSLLPATT